MSLIQKEDFECDLPLEKVNLWVWLDSWVSSLPWLEWILFLCFDIVWSKDLCPVKYWTQMHMYVYVIEMWMYELMMLNVRLKLLGFACHQRMVESSNLSNFWPLHFLPYCPMPYLGLNFNFLHYISCLISERGFWLIFYLGMWSYPWNLSNVNVFLHFCYNFKN